MILVKDANGNVINIDSADNLGNGAQSWIQVNKSFEMAVTQGLIPGWSYLRKFGENPSVVSGTDTQDISQVTGESPIANDAFGTAPVVSIGSNGNDSGKQVLVIGNDIGNNVVTQVITLGAIRTALTTPLYRAYRAILLGGTEFDGDVFLYTGIGTIPSIGDPEVRLFISKEDNKTQHCIYTVPDGKVFMLCDAKVGLEYVGTGIFAADGVATLKFKTRLYNGLWTTEDTVSVLSGGSSSFSSVLSSKPLIPARTDIKITCTNASENMGLWGEFEGYIIDEDQISAERLAEINQPS